MTDPCHAGSDNAPTRPEEARIRMDAPAAQGAGEAAAIRPLPAHSAASTRKSPLRVLLIEDSPLIRERLAESIADPGRIEIIGQAESEQAAIGMLGAAPWDVMVLDLQLRHGTGLGVLRALISRRPPNVKVIVLTNYAFPQYRAKSLALGADHFFDKAHEYHCVREVLERLAAERVAGAH